MEQQQQLEQKQRAVVVAAGTLRQSAQAVVDGNGNDQHFAGLGRRVGGKGGSQHHHQVEKVVQNDYVPLHGGDAAGERHEGARAALQRRQHRGRVGVSFQKEGKKRIGARVGAPRPDNGSHTRGDGGEEVSEGLGREALGEEEGEKTVEEEEEERRAAGLGEVGGAGEAREEGHGWVDALELKGEQRQLHALLLDALTIPITYSL